MSRDRDWNNQNNNQTNNTTNNNQSKFNRRVLNTEEFIADFNDVDNQTAFVIRNDNQLVQQQNPNPVVNQTNQQLGSFNNQQAIVNQNYALNQNEPVLMAQNQLNQMPMQAQMQAQNQPQPQPYIQQPPIVQQQQIYQQPNNQNPYYQQPVYVQQPYMQPMVQPVYQQPVFAANYGLADYQSYQHGVQTRSFIPRNLNDFIYQPLDEQEKIEIDSSSQIQTVYQTLDKTKMPDFYKKEIGSMRNKVLFWTLLLLVAVALISWLAYEVVVNSLSAWIFLPTLVYTVVIIFFLAIASSNLINFKKEYEYQNNKFDRSKATNFIVNIYRKLIVAHININWVAAYVYLTSAFCIAGVFVVAYFMNLYLNAAENSHFGSLVVLNIKDPNYMNKNPMYAVIGLGTIIATTFLIHLWVIFQAHNRLNRIHSFYQNEIISGDEIIALKKQANRRGFVIFLVLSIILGLIFYLMYLILKRKVNIKK
ncbi:MSC_0882 family membrane protein [Ureaplasma diversum]|uniref:MSC_0882 family membrane protein n=1 Tax=Ureaplasma diversum TaxID=42094 RepID=UPI000A4FF932|nr:hypothetical protein [Ureaplasma diversum]